MSLVKDSTLTFISQFLAMVIQFASTIIVARILGVEGKGIYVLIFLPSFVIINVISCGITVSQIYYLGKSKYNKNDLLSNVLIIGLVVSVIGIILFLIIFPSIHKIFFTGINPKFFYLSLLIIPTHIITSYLRHYFLGNKRVKEFNIILIIWRLFINIILILFIVILNLKIYGAVIAVSAGELLTFITVILLINKIYKITFNYNWNIIRDLLDYGLRVQAGQILDMIAARLDLWMIAYFLAPRAIGLYSVALVSQALIAIPDSVGINLFRRLTNLSYEESRIKSKIVVRNLLFLILLLVAFFAVTGKYVIIYFYGINFADAFIPFLLLLPGVIFLTISKNLKAFLSSVNKPQLASYASVLSFLINFSLNYILIPKWGISGAAFATSTSLLVYATFIFFFYIKISKNSVSETLVISKPDLIFFKTFLIEIKSKIIKTNIIN